MTAQATLPPAAISSIVPANSPLSPTSLALCLAFIHYCSPNRVRRGPLLRAADTRRLTAWLGLPHVAAASPRHDPALAAHLIWLTAAGLLHVADPGLCLSPRAAVWLHDLPENRLAVLLDVEAGPRWDAAAVLLRLPDAVPAPYRQLLRQSLQRQLPAPDHLAGPIAAWDGATGDTWRLRLLPCPDPGLLFDLLGLGRFELPHTLCCSPLTLGAGHAQSALRARDLGFDRARWLLETALSEPLDEPRQAQLRGWFRRAAAYRLRGPLLQTAQPDQLAALYTVRPLRPFLLEQLSPRCALFDRAGLPALRRRLAAWGYPLNDDAPCDSPPAGGDPAASDQASHWLGLRLLAGLARYLHLPQPAPYHALNRLAAHLPPDDLAQLEAQADRLLDDLQAVIQGRDAFFPAQRPPDEALVADLRRALADEQPLTILYGPPGDAEPRRHTIEPLRLEWRGQLGYLVAYSYRAEAQLSFRLDRIETLDALL